MSERQKTVHYRRCYLEDGQGNDASGGETLESALYKAALSVARPWQRKIGIGGNTFHLLTNLVGKNQCLCGEIALYESGRKVPLVGTEGDGSTFQGNIDPVDAKGKHRELQEHSLFFAIRENHVALMQSLALKTNQMQEFLDWIIKTKAGLLDKALITLVNLPSQMALQKLKDHTVRRIKFGERLFSEIKEQQPPGPDGKKKKAVKVIKTHTWAADVLCSSGWKRPIIDRLQKGNPGAIKVDVDIHYHSRSEKDSVEVLRAFAGTLAGQEELKTEIYLSDDTLIKHDEICLQGKVLVQHPDGCIAVDDALTKVSQWLANQIKFGNVV